MTNPNTTEVTTLNLFICLAIISLFSHLNLIKIKKTITITILLLSFSLSAQTKKHSSKLGVFSYCAIYSWPKLSKVQTLLKLLKIF